MSLSQLTEIQADPTNNLLAVSRAAVLALITSTAGTAVFLQSPISPETFELERSTAVYRSVGNGSPLMLLTFLKEELATAGYLKAQGVEQGLLCCALVCWSRNARRACRCRVYFT